MRINHVYNLQTLRYDAYMQPHCSGVLAIRSAVWGLQLISGTLVWSWLLHQESCSSNCSELP